MTQPAPGNMEDVEANFEKFKNFGNYVFEEYSNLHTKMWSNLKPDHLEPFVKTLLEHQNIALKGQTELIETIRQNLQLQTQQVLNNFWHSNSVSEALISLEICKEKFKSYQGQKWNMDAKTPWERTRPIRAHFKENRIRYLQAQLNFQNKQLEQIMEENISQRQRIQDVKNERIHLMELISNARNKIQLAKEEMMELHKQILSADYGNVESNQVDNYSK